MVGVGKAKASSSASEGEGEGWREEEEEVKGIWRVRELIFVESRVDDPPPTRAAEVKTVRERVGEMEGLEFVEEKEIILSREGEG